MRPSALTINPVDMTGKIHSIQVQIIDEASIFLLVNINVIYRQCNLHIHMFSVKQATERLYDVCNQ